MKIALAQYNYHVGNFEGNTSKIIHGIEEAKKRNADLVVFSELAVCGYPSADLLEFEEYIHKSYESLEKIAAHCTGIAAVVGAPDKNQGPKGKPLYNAAFFLSNKKITRVFHKGLLPNYDIFDEYRYFEPANQFQVLEYKNKRIALTICEDLWNLNDNPLYLQNPMDKLYKQGVDLMINIAASPFSWNHIYERKSMLSQNAATYNLPMFYVNQVGAQTDVIFDGGSMVINPQGEIVKELASFEEDLSIVELSRTLSSEGSRPIPSQDTDQKNERIYKALILGVKDYFQKLGFTKAILGLSGGIDSAVTMVIAAEALGAKNVLGVLMPGQFSSDHSIQDAQELAENLGSPYHTIQITKTAHTFEQHLHPWFKDTDFNVAEENIQARTRAVYLMALSNKFGHVLLNTSNKSEAAVGYGTLYGDMCGGMSVLGDLYKTEVFELARYINRKKRIIPQNSITKPPSAELRPDQKDADSLPEYNILDPILFEYIENRKGPEALYSMGFEQTMVDRVLKLVNYSEHKRFQTPPVLRVSLKSFGAGRKMPIVAKYL